MKPMSGQFFLIDVDLSASGMWHLSMDVSRVWPLFRGKRIPPNQAHESVRVTRSGHRLPLTFTAMNIPVIRSSLARVIEKLAPDDVQFIPAMIDDGTPGYEVLNVLTRIDCIDDERTVFTNYRGHGDFDAIEKPALRADRIGTARIFRPVRWEANLIASGPIANRLAQERLPAVVIQPVPVF